MVSFGERTLVGAVRFCAFVPSPGFHPGLLPHDPVVIEWQRPGLGARRIELFGWIPGGGVYPSLPADDEEAARRRRERVVVGPHDPSGTPVREPRFVTAGGFTLDLRRER
jgi:uncharacterized protein (DUF2126 family)